MTCICVNHIFRHSAKSNPVRSTTHMLHIWSRALCVRRCWGNRCPACRPGTLTSKWMRRLGIILRHRSSRLNKRLRPSNYSSYSNSSSRLSRCNSSNSSSSSSSSSNSNSNSNSNSSSSSNRPSSFNRLCNSKLRPSSAMSKRKRKRNKPCNHNSNRRCNRHLNSICNTDSLVSIQRSIQCVVLVLLLLLGVFPANSLLVILQQAPVSQCHPSLLSPRRCDQALYL